MQSSVCTAIPFSVLEKGGRAVSGTRKNSSVSALENGINGYLLFYIEVRIVIGDEFTDVHEGIKQDIPDSDPVEETDENAKLILYKKDLEKDASDYNTGCIFLSKYQVHKDSIRIHITFTCFYVFFRIRPPK